MHDLLELQTGQVAFLSGLLSGFSLTIAVHILRHGIIKPAAQWAFCCFLITTVLFLISLYVDVRLTIELAGLVNPTEEQVESIASIRVIGTNSASAAFALFIFSIGLLGWIISTTLGLISSMVAAATIGILGYVWFSIQAVF